MIILITGASHTGKTLLAQRMLEKYKYPYLSIDHLKMGWQGWLLMGILSMPLVLASPISFFIMLGYIPVIAKRIRNEEAILEEGLKGYKEYKLRVKYRVIPWIW